MIINSRDQLIKTLASGIRLDGRKPLDFRRVEIETGVIETAEGSARVKIGDTEVFVGVKLMIDKPFPDTPEEGVIMVGAELVPLASPEFESGPPADEAIELARIIDRGLRESHAIEVEKLCITPGEKVWLVSIDIVPINDDGNLIDASGIGALAALQTAVFPKVENDNVAYREPRTNEKLPMKRAPIPITVYKIGETFIVDPLKEEESCYDARLTVAVTENNTISALQKGGEKGLSEKEIMQMVDIAIEKSKELRKYIR